MPQDELHLGTKSSLILTFDENGRLCRISSYLSREEERIEVSESSSWGKLKSTMEIVGKPEGIEEWAKELDKNSPFPLKLIFCDVARSDRREVRLLRGYIPGTAAVVLHSRGSDEGWEIRFRTKVLGFEVGENGGVVRAEAFCLPIGVLPSGKVRTGSS